MEAPEAASVVRDRLRSRAAHQQAALTKEPGSNRAASNDITQPTRPGGELSGTRARSVLALTREAIQKSTSARVISARIRMLLRNVGGGGRRLKGRWRRPGREGRKQ